MFESFLLMLTYLPSSLSRSSILWYAPSLNSVLMLTFMKGDLWSDYHSNKKKSKAKLAARTHTGHLQLAAERSSWETVGRQRALVTRQDGGIAATWCTVCLCVFLCSLFQFCHQSCPQNFALWFCSVFYCFCSISFSLSFFGNGGMNTWARGLYRVWGEKRDSWTHCCSGSAYTHSIAHVLLSSFYYFHAFFYTLCVNLSHNVGGTYIEETCTSEIKIRNYDIL